MSQIIALVYISLSELQTINPSITEEWASANPLELEKALYGVGLNTELPYEVQMLTHRNRFGSVITCSRYVGNERLDDEWLKSGYASEEAIARKLDNKLLNDIFRMKGLTENYA